MDYSFLKQKLRTKAVRLRSEIAPDHALWCAREIVRRFNDLPLPENPVVSAYWPMKTELDVRPLMFSLHNKGIPVCLPVVVEVDAPLSFRLWRPDAKLVAGPYGTEQPDERCATVVPNVLLLPLLAFDNRGGRLGYGGGYYDRTVACLRQRGNPAVVGVAFSDQEIDAVPSEKTDERLNFVLTEEKIVKGL